MIMRRLALTLLTLLACLVSRAQIVNRLNGIRMKNTATARKLFSLKKLLQEPLEFYIEEEKKLIEELGGAIQTDGTIIFPNQDEGMKKLTEGRKKLGAAEWEVPIDTPIIFRDNEGLVLSGDEIGNLDGLADFKE